MLGALGFAGKLGLSVVGAYSISTAVLVAFKLATEPEPDPRDLLTRFVDKFTEEVGNDFENMRDWIELIREIASNKWETNYD